MDDRAGIECPRSITPQPEMTRPKRRRTQKLIRPGLQLRMVGAFAGLATLGLLLQFLVLSYRMTDELMKIDGPAGQIAVDIPGVMLEVLFFSLAVLLPVIAAFGVLLTFRVAGPVHRFEAYFESLARGEQVGPCKLRKGDEMQELCERINAATEPLRRRTVQPEAARERISPAG